MNRISRISEMETKFDNASLAIKNLDDALNAFMDAIPDIESLIEYYESKDWMNDFEDDNKGLLPKDLKKGVLSEDGIYNMLSDYQRLKKLLKSNMS